MALFDLFSKRQRRLRGDAPDVYQYDSVSSPLRVQIVHILREAIGQTGQYHHRANGAWRFIHDSLAREYGEFQLAEGSTHEEAATRFLLESRDQIRALDFIEFAFRYVDRVCREDGYRWEAQPSVTADEAITELNDRLREQSLGYQYVAGNLIRVDSELVHAEVVKHALNFLHAKYLAGANTEYLRAHEHYRRGRYEESLADCLKSFESTMKAICHNREWPYNQTDTAKRLIEIVLAKGLIPAYLQSEFTGLRTSLESGIPTVRNKQSGHGQGVEQREVPRHLAAYLLHLTAATILLLADANDQLR